MDRSMAPRIGPQDRGAVLVLLAIFLFIFLVVAALAVDLSALERRGQTLQNTADAAALAGVVTWQETGDLTLAWATVGDLVRQNGLTGDDIEIAVDLVSDVELRVTITDTEPDVFLGSIVNLGGNLVRDASARFEACEADCNRVVELPAPFPPTAVTGSGDGYYPIAVGNRFYGINHDADEIACVDRETRSPCWTNRLALPYSGADSDPVAHAAVVDTRIFWVGQEREQLTLFCWQTVTESPCRETPLAPLARGTGLGKFYRNRGGGTIAIGSRVFVFTDDHRVRCVNAETYATCAGYEGGRPTGLAKLGFEPLDPRHGAVGSNIDRVLNERTGQVFHTLHILTNSRSEDVWEPGIYIDCWDTTTNDTCAGFTPHEIHVEAQRQSGRLFLHRTSGGVPNGVCSTGAGDVKCIELDGTASAPLEAGMAALEAELPPADQYTNGMGVHVYHEPSNRLILSSPRQLSTNHCWDFRTGSYCGSLYGFAGGNQTEDYGFIVEGACLYGLGHNSIFWAFTIDMTEGCPGATAEQWIDKCDCSGLERWGLLTFNFDIGPDSPFGVLNIQILDQDDNLVYPDNGDDWVRMVGRPSDVIDLSPIPTTYDRLKVRVYLETDGTDPWEDDDPPSLVFGFRTLPYLSE